MSRRKAKKVQELAIVHENACGIDVGSTFHMVAIGLEKTDIKKFGVYTKDHHRLIDWLTEKEVKHIAMESTGSYWQTLFGALQQAGFDVILVDGKQTKSLKKKTDVKDARSIYQLHSLGLLQGCFLPDEQTNNVRVYYRHRSKLIEESTRLSNRMQQAMRLMNIRLDNVLNDIMGVSGRRIIEAIINGERDAKQLASLADKRVRKTKEEIEKGLEGQWNEAQIFVLQDCYDTYQQIQHRVKKIDQQIKSLLEQNQTYQIPEDKPLKKKKVGKNQIDIQLQKLSYSQYGVDLFEIPNVGYNLVMTIISEIGTGFHKFSTSKEFTSYLRVAPNNRISGGKKLSGRTPKGSNALGIAFRNAANTVSNQKSGSLKSFFNRKSYQKGRAVAITATARKLATIVWNMITHKEDYVPMDQEIYEDKVKRKAIANMKRTMKRLGIDPNDFIMYKSLDDRALKVS